MKNDADRFVHKYTF